MRKLTFFLLLTGILTTLLPAESIYRLRSDFTSDTAYGSYVENTLQPGDLVVANQDYEKIKAGSIGIYYGKGKWGSPPCPVVWIEDLKANPAASALPDTMPEGMGSHIYFVHWYTLDILKARPDVIVPLRVTADTGTGKVTAGMQGWYYGPGLRLTPPIPILWDKDLAATPAEDVLPAGYPKNVASRIYFVDWSNFSVSADTINLTAYGTWLKDRLGIGQRVVALRSAGKVKKGQFGTYFGDPGNASPPCPILWDDDLSATPNTDHLPDAMPQGFNSHIYFVDWNLVGFAHPEDPAPPRDIADYIPGNPEGDDYYADDEYYGDDYYGDDYYGDDYYGDDYYGDDYYGDDYYGDDYYGDDISGTESGEIDVNVSPDDLGLTPAHSLPFPIRVRAVRDVGSVYEGDGGWFYGTGKAGYPPVPIVWDDDKDATPNEDALPDGFPSDSLTQVYFVSWGDFEIDTKHSSFRRYENYIRDTLKPGDVVVALSEYEKVKPGMTGTYYGDSPSASPPCPILWDIDIDATPNTDHIPSGMPSGKNAHIYFVPWSVVAILGLSGAADASRSPVAVPPGKTDLPALRVRALSDYNKVKTGMTGWFYGAGKETCNPPAPVVWDEDLSATPGTTKLPDGFPKDRLSSLYYVQWNLLELIPDRNTSAAWTTWMKENAQIGDRIVALADNGPVKKGMTGTYYGTVSGKDNTCPILWDDELSARPDTSILPRAFPKGSALTRAYPVNWSEISIVPPLQ